MGFSVGSQISSVQEAAEVVGELMAKIREYIFGQDDLIHEVICCLLSGGHILITGAPGLAKTSLIRVIGSHLGLKFGRIQFTPDLLPSDIIGSEILDVDLHSGKRTFSFSKGPIFANLILADEINRASPRTQSALLEAMQERTCTVGGIMHKLPPPFMVFATQNPFESEGTFPLPEAQLDRFLLHSFISYPSEEAEEKIITEHVRGKLFGEIEHVVRFEDNLKSECLLSLMEKTSQITVEVELIQAITRLVRSTRPEDMNCPLQYRDMIWYGAGPRAGISLISLSKACALIEGEKEVRWRHIKRMAKPALRHRIRLGAKARIQAIVEENVIDQLIIELEQKHGFLSKGLS